MSKIIASSGSSLHRRKKLNSDYVVLPDVLSVLSIEIYFKFARQLLDEANSTFIARDLPRSYVQYKKFIEFVLHKLRHHKDYDSRQKEKDKLMATIKGAMTNLEYVVKKMDEEEDEKIAKKEVMLLIDAFDGEFDDNPVIITETQAYGQEYSHENTQERTEVYTEVQGYLPVVISETVLDSDNLSYNSSAYTDIDQNPLESPPEYYYACIQNPQENKMIEPVRAVPVHTEIEMPPEYDIINSQEDPLNIFYPDYKTKMDSEKSEIMDSPILFGNSQKYSQGNSITNASPNVFQKIHSQELERKLSYDAIKFNNCLKVLSYDGKDAKNDSRRVHFNENKDWYQPVPELIQLNQIETGSSKQVYTSRNRFFIPNPNSTQIDFKIGLKPFRFLHDDFQVLFSPFLRTLDSKLQMESAALETNRCFFLHLGIAMQLHPFCLQVAFRHMAAIKMENTPTDDMSYDLLSSVTAYAGFVDANCLIYLWPSEFDSCRICIISGSINRPIFSCFFSQEGIRKHGGQHNLRDVIIYCNGSHFTLLRPFPVNQESSFSILSELLSAARMAGLIVQENIVEENNNRTSVPYILKELQYAARQ